ncbi:MAG: hypothetical protein KGJ00_11265 [Bradyrhizobium sp.]|uniref:hypothetical protein n=1 Tax=Bradyrhizobium sp. TaxID=376 RepID=UPI0023844BF4|nr:hypothetical protein [Bradyrhizobium sp.]MDE2062980.1 hypothetical protein [Bradyrhizobium sp.]
MIDNKQTTWREFGCFVARPNMFVCKMSQPRHSGILFQDRRYAAANLFVGRNGGPEGSAHGTRIAKT